MTSQNNNNSSSAIRHRIKEISLQPATARHLIKLEILVDGQTVLRPPSPEPGPSLRWVLDTYPCDVRPESKIELKFTKTHPICSDREATTEYFVSETAGQTSMTRSGIVLQPRSSAFGFASRKEYTVTVSLLDVNEVAQNYSVALAKATEMIGNENGPLERMGNARQVLKTTLDFGRVVAELHPIAKLVVGLCTRAWEHLETLQGQHDSLQQLISGMAEMCPFIESVKTHAKEALKDIIMALLYLIEDTSNFILNYVPQAGVGRSMRELVDATASDRIAQLLERFGQLKESFDRGVGVQVMEEVLSSAQRSSINQLKPTAYSIDTKPSPCQEGTRTQVLEDIRAWYSDTNNSQKLLWLYGQAGVGKSAIAASVCQMFHNAGTLGAHYFFKRDDPYLRSPEHMLNTVVHHLALQYEPYGQAVASAIEEYSGLLDMPLGQRYTHLVERPLRDLEFSFASPRETLVIVVDAIDECENTDSRRTLLAYLREMSWIAPWFKVVVTSRPDEDIKSAFDSASYDYVYSLSLVDYDSSEDMMEYTQKRMAGIAHRKKLQWDDDMIRKLSERAGGLFIWMETACKFIERGANAKGRLNQILDGNQPTEGYDQLDSLYMIAIQQAMGDQGTDNMRSYRECIGAIVVTGSRKPLPVTDLASLLSSYLEPEVLHAVVRGLGSVLYEDPNQTGAIRVYHPSFADFILDPARSKNFHTDPKQQEAMLANCCLKTMMRELSFNVCGLETSHLLNDEVPNFRQRVLTAINQRLEYSCMHWYSHLMGASDCDLQDQLSDFLYGSQLLFWIEVMSLLGQLSVALSSLLGLIDWTSTVQKIMEDHSSYASDAYRFVLTFHDAISKSTPHLYVSALAFAPTTSQVAKRMRPLFPNTFIFKTGANEGWPEWLQIMSHNDSVRSIACSGDGRHIVSASDDGMVRIWDSETGAAVSEPLASPDVYCVAISSDGRRIASGAYDGALRIWDAETGTAELELSEEWLDHCISIEFSPDGQHIFCCYKSGIAQVIDTEIGAKVSDLRLVHQGDMLATSLSSDTRHIASCSADGTVRVWSTETGDPVTEPFTGHSDEVNCVAFSPNGRLVASGSADKTVLVWDISTGTELRRLARHSSPISSVAFSPNGCIVVSGSIDRTAQVWDVGTGMPTREPLVGHASDVTAVAFCSNGRRIVSASDDKMVRIWDVGANVAASKALAGHSAPVNSVSFSFDSHYIASGSDDGTVRIWDTHTGEEAFMPCVNCSEYPASCVMFTPDSQRIVFLAGPSTVQVWDMRNGYLTTEFSLSNSERVLSIALSPDGSRIASGSEDHTVGLWDLESGAAVFPPLAGHSAGVRSVAFSPNGRFIGSGSDDGTIKIWDAETGNEMGEPLTGHSDFVRSVCFSPDSRRVASGSDDTTVRVWGAETGAALLEPLRGHTLWVFCVVFSPDGHFIISGSYDWTVRIWDADTGAAIAEPLVGHSHWVECVTISPSGDHIATGSWDRAVRIWDMKTATTDPEVLMDALCSDPSALVLSTGFLAQYANESGWVTSSDGALLLWLPKDCRHRDNSKIQISVAPFEPKPLFIDFSKFMHGNAWVSVASD